MKRMIGLLVWLGVASPANAQVQEFSMLIDNQQAQAAGNCLQGSSAGGLGEAFFDPATGELSWAILFGDNPPAFDNGLLSNGAEILAHFHNAPPGVNGPVEIDLGVGASKIGSAVLTATQAAELAAGNFYVNIHSTGCLAGEIRGQVNRVVMPTVIPTVVPTPEPTPKKKAKKSKKVKKTKAKKAKKVKTKKIKKAKAKKSKKQKK